MLLFYHNIKNIALTITYTSFLKGVQQALLFLMTKRTTTETYLTPAFPLSCPRGGAVGCTTPLSLLSEHLGV